MKKLLLLLLLVAGAQAQIVNIADPAFKAALIEDGVDTNNDGEIQLTEAVVVTSMNVNTEGITSLEGVNSFANLTYLDASYNNLTAVDIHDLPYLVGINVYTNLGLQTAAFANLPQLSSINIGRTAITSFTISDCPNLDNLNADFFTGPGCVFDLSSCTNLNEVSMSMSQVISLDVHGTLIADIQVSHSNIQYIDASNTPNLFTLKAEGCTALQSLNMQGSNVYTLRLYDCGLTELDLSQTTGLHNFEISLSSSLTSLNLSGCNQVSNILADYCPLQSLNLSGCSSCHTLYVRDSALTSLDLTECTSLSTLWFGNSPIQTLLAKNGSNEYFDNLYSASNLDFLCIDESQYVDVLNSLPANSTVVVSPYCSFIPGGNFNSLAGSVTLDIDNDGCDAQDPGQAFTTMSFTSGTNQYATFSLTDGNYLSYITGTGTYLVQPALENPSLFTVTPPTSQLTLSGTTTSADLDFCITPNGIHHDVEVTIAPLSVIRPGFDASYAVTYRNKGNQVENGQVSFLFDDDKLDLVSTSQAPANSATGNLSWNFTGLLPYESRSITVTVNANSPVETPAVNIGDIMTYNVSVTPTQGDESLADNTFTLNHTVVGAYDPNDITCLEGDVVSPSLIGQFLHYNVNFENTGNYPAENVVVRMKMDASKFDMSSMQFIGSSHQPRIQRSGDLVEFIFEGIQLPAEGKGYVLFKIKTKNTLVTGNSVSQKADIYFDFNAPVATNTATTTFQQLNIVTPSAEAFVLWPNPASDVITISGAADIEAISILNLLGQEVYYQKGNGRGAQVNVSSLPTGNYLVRVKAAGGEQLLKLVKK